MIFKLLKYYFSLCYWQNASPDKIRKMQVRKFASLFNYAKTHSAFYEKLYKDAGIFDLEIKTIQDIQKIPVIDKYLLREFKYEEILTRPLHKSENLNVHPTSGSSGEPFKIYFDKFTDYTSHVRVFFALRKAASYTPFKKITMITRYEEGDKFQVEGDLSLIQKLQKFLGIFEREIISIYRKPDFIIDRILETKPYILWSTPSILEIVVGRMIERGISIKIPYLFFTSENLSPVQFEKFSKHISNNIVDIYGAMESPCLGYELNKSGKRIIYPNSNLFEVINERDSEIGKTGDVIITNLLNYTMPVIRYDVKDSCKILDGKDPTQKFIGEILGRKDDILIFNDGNKFAHHHAHEMFMDFEECDQFKFIQTSNNLITLQLKANINFSEEEVEAEARQRWNRRFAKYPLNIQFVDQFYIDSKTGKFKNIERVSK